MRELIAEEEKEIIANLKIAGGMGAIMTLLGIPKIFQMFKFIAKQFFYGRAYLWIKEKLAGILLAAVLLILVFYIHSEYLNYVEFKSKNDESYIGASFIIKTAFIILILIGYFYFYRTINKTKESF